MEPLPRAAHEERFGCRFAHSSVQAAKLTEQVQQQSFDAEVAVFISAIQLSPHPEQLCCQPLATESPGPLESARGRAICAGRVGHFNEQETRTARTDPVAVLGA